MCNVQSAGSVRWVEWTVLALPAGESFDVFTNGKGLMKGYRYPIPATDRWAIIAYARQLQQRQAEEVAAP